MKGVHTEQFFKAMKTEVKSLIQQKTWNMTLRSEATIGNWYQVNMGIPSLLFARWNSTQVQNLFLCFEMDASVVQWSTICMLLYVIEKRMGNTAGRLQKHLLEQK
jgi:hypothetical protein